MKWLVIIIVVAVMMVILIPIVRRMLNQRLEQQTESTAELPLVTTAQTTKTANVAVQEAPKSHSQVSATSVKTAEEHLDAIPEDASLRRHFLSTRQAERLAVTHPYPTDATLRRHHESYLMSLLTVETAVVTLPESKPSVSAPIEPIAAVVAEQEPAHPHIPEDSMLRRHFLTEIAAKTAI